MTAPAFGPWSPGLPDLERACRFRCLATLGLILAGPGSRLCDLALAAESGVDRGQRHPIAALEALESLEALPPLRRRRILAALNEVTERARLRG